MSHHEVLGFIELLLEPILAIIFVFVVEVVFYGIFYKITEAISVGLNEASESIESVANTADKTPENRAVIICSLIMSGIVVGSLFHSHFQNASSI